MNAEEFARVKKEHFGPFVEQVLEHMAIAQQAHTKLEQVLLKIKVDNSCSNVKELADALNVYAAGVETAHTAAAQVITAHLDTQHDINPHHHSDDATLDALGSILAMILTGKL